MRKSLTIVQRGLVLIALPLVFELGLICLVSVAESAAETAAARESHAKLVLAKSNSLMQELIELSSSSALFSVTHFSEYEKAAVKASNAVTEQWKQLERMTAGDVRLTGALQTWSDDLFKFIGLVADTRRAITSSSESKDEDFGLLDGTAVKSAMVVYTRKNLAHSRNFTKMVAEQQAPLEGLTAQWRRTLHLVLGFGVVGNLLLSLVLARFFAATINTRLATLSINTRALADGKDFTPPLEGLDEIAQVDKDFRKMASALQEARAREQELESLKRDFVNMLSHDLRTPMSSVSLFLDNMRLGVYGVLSEKGVRSCDTVKNNVNRLIEMVNDLLDIEKVEAGKLTVNVETDDLVTLIEDCVLTLEPLITTSKLNLVIEADEPVVLPFDAERLVRVVTNLLSNAIKFSPPDSTITISCRCENNYAVTSIKDEGPGIPTQELPFIFDRFRSAGTESRVPIKGTGLGLALCKMLIELHNGTISVVSEEGKGTCFTFSLPLGTALERAPITNLTTHG